MQPDRSSADQQGSAETGVGHWLQRELPRLILLGFGLGLAAGWVLGPAATGLGILSDIFVRLLQMIVAPLILSTVITGVHEAARQPNAGHLSARVVLSFLLLSGTALLIGMLGAHVVQPGAGIQLGGAATTPVPAGSFKLVEIVPRNIVDSLARGDTLQLVVFGLLFAWAALQAGEPGTRAVRALSGLTEILFSLTRLLVILAPLAAFGATAELVGGQGISVLSGFVELILLVLAGLMVLALLVIPAYLLANAIPIAECWRAARAAVTVGFATASGAAALAIAIESLVKAGVPQRVVSFVVPLGSVFNLAGSTLFVGTATLFLLQAAGQSPNTPDLLALFASLFVATKAIPAVPRASLALIAATVSSAGLPSKTVAVGIGALLAVDAILDMTRTGVNIWGNCAIAMSIGRHADRGVNASRNGSV